MPLDTLLFEILKLLHVSIELILLMILDLTKHLELVICYMDIGMMMKCESFWVIAYLELRIFEFFELLRVV